MKLILFGGSGDVGSVLKRYFAQHEIVVISRSANINALRWDGRTLGRWTEQIDGADVVINLAGRSVNCRYHAANLKEMMDSRVESTRIVGEAIARAANPPRVWLQASSATYYAHTFGPANDELTGEIDTSQNAPRTWKASIDIIRAWEHELEVASTPATRKVAMRSSLILSRDPGSVYDVLRQLTRRGLGGSLAGGRQYVSWIHEVDFGRAVEYLIQEEGLCGAVNICAPNPLPQREFSAVLRRSHGIPLGLPAAKWMIELGTFLMRTESELVLKSRRVVPTRLLHAGFEFRFPTWPAAAEDLANSK